MTETANSRERLLDAAADLMYARGYEAVSVADLCAAADARKGSFYHWWPSKRDLAIAMLERAWEQNRARMFDPIFGSDAPVVERFQRYADFLADGLATNRRRTGHVVGCRFGNFAVELSTRDDAVRERVADTFARIAGVFEAAIREGMKSGEIAAGTDAHDTAQAILAQMEGLMVVAKAKDDPQVLRRLGRDAARLMGAAPGGQPS
ncbi:MAG: TetR/AcrR family transcriptional regulator [Rickettsiales bacterium]